MSDARGRKAIFITGAASGMGRATARLFAEQGWFIGAFDIDMTGLAGLQQEIGSENCLIRRLDVADKADMDQAVQAFGAATGGRMDYLFNNAGIGHSGWFEDVPHEAALKLVQINLVGVLNGIYAALPLLKATPGSFIFSTSSSSATYGMPRIAVYAATKFAVKGLTEALSVEFSRFGIRVADILPGLIDTAILRTTPNHSNDASKAVDIEGQAPKKGMFRLMPAEAIAKAAFAAYGSTRLHWYVPPEIEWIDRLKVFFPNFIRRKVGAAILARVAARRK